MVTFPIIAATRGSAVNLDGGDRMGRMHLWKFPVLLGKKIEPPTPKPERNSIVVRGLVNIQLRSSTIRFASGNKFSERRQIGRQNGQLFLF